MPTAGDASDKPPAVPTGKTQLAIGDGLQWPSIEAAIKWLEDQDVVREAKLDDIAAQTDSQAQRVHGIVVDSFGDKLARELAKSLELGESREEWKKRAKDIADWQRGQDETIHRTLTHRAYHEGLKQSVEEFPEVRGLFPYLLYQATHDDRVRDDHLALDGKIAHVDAPLAGEMKSKIDEWNCRCTLVPLSKEDALAQGITQDAPPPVIPIGVSEREAPGIAARPAARPPAPTPARRAPAVTRSTDPPESDDPRRLKDGRRVEFIQHETAPDDNVLVEIDATELDKFLQRDPDFYVPPGGEAGAAVKGRVSAFDEFADKHTKGDEVRGIQAPRAFIDSRDSLPSLQDGRHRTRWLIDHGARRIVITVHPEEVDRIVELLNGRVVDG